ncbi:MULTISPECIES: precorrin-6Y C5,15-methyltransferase subunit CbiT [unclassified Synechocystis]|uniref:precorrin-6Y C5,15-methyltransferase subunit CbiT n=1 Tax=unclassified Synechocystis TaxID=2640012 RepID=UPI00048AEEB4|nr:MULTISPECIES: precorrin-6Y C5,15-methyltransferase subunit CbiT [unclassified Synechocystis]MCT0254794.1 precorrin-6Y C5,15-methyltransferase subunit CbiT [Synechocystis sp. CS-94]
MLWPYKTPGITDSLFERLPGIPLSKREVRLLIISALQLREESIIWDIGAGTGTIPVELGLLCPRSNIVAVERDEEVAALIRRNCEQFGVTNVTVHEGSAPDCLPQLIPHPTHICIEGGRPIKQILQETWAHLAPGGRLVATANNLESLYGISETLSALQVRNVEVVQAGVNRLEKRGLQQVFAAVDPTFILAGEKLS